MKYTMLLFLFCCFISFGQKPPIEIKIDTITSSDSIPDERIFTVNYHIENLTDSEISFFLNPNGMTPNARASMSKNVNFKLFQNEEIIDIDDIFTTKASKLYEEGMRNAKTEDEKNAIMTKFFEDNLKINLDSINIEAEKHQFDENYDKQEKQKWFSESTIKLKPKEIKHYSHQLEWFKNRYFKIDAIEYYLDEKTPHYFEISINLMKAEFKNQLTEEDFQTIMNNKNFIKEWFTSNKVEINFKE